MAASTTAIPGTFLLEKSEKMPVDYGSPEAVTVPSEPPEDQPQHREALLRWQSQPLPIPFQSSTWTGSDTEVEEQRTLLKSIMEDSSALELLY
ncbi:hypothetical protein BP00DRAFT_451913 [Aspergillus indologenus CBS 114.80]|uniref:Uncharacterized protein n=1 Tax=Aspergillus indologenus CBS 114.80 TaxID=1450541 RepID=A0A2V5HU93_9EURO|nr:hypothetical protein BP00DRAFT_451913 [Aspergillus indologenus CBS 114.80]